ncbi:MAG TPA: AtpZ/AtpI family protein [Vicinamibacterales bacterium]|nr:AtpZ/AtpI family protein [Vicinamibacterales bacterium]
MNSEESASARSNRAMQDNLDRNAPRILAAYGLVGAILLFGAVGYALDRWIATAPWFLLAGLATGIVVGGYEVITASRRS